MWWNSNKIVLVFIETMKGMREGSQINRKLFSQMWLCPWKAEAEEAALITSMSNTGKCFEGKRTTEYSNSKNSKVLFKITEIKSIVFKI